DHPSDKQNTNAFHGFSFREDALFARTSDGGQHWNGGDLPVAQAGYPAGNITNFQENVEAFGNEIVVQPNGDLGDVFTNRHGSGSQKVKADRTTLGVVRSTDHGFTWSDVTTGPGIESVDVADPDHPDRAVRAGEPLTSVAVDPINGNIYAVWADGRFSGYAHD